MAIWHIYEKIYAKKNSIRTKSEKIIDEEKGSGAVVTPCKRPPTPNWGWGGGWGCKKKKKCLRSKMSSICFVECFVKVHVRVHSTSNETCGELMPHLWWQKAPVQFLFVNPALLSSVCWRWEEIHRGEKPEPRWPRFGNTSFSVVYRWWSCSAVIW